ncbi:hypothetical protein J6590_069737 [Homalodisca vitripennis]|nr:hypothetical protein J6590_069737 [Homalodisca vitripennis]
MFADALSVRALSTYVSTHWIIQTALLVPRRNMFADVFRRNTPHLIISQNCEHIFVNTLDNLESVACPTAKHACRCIPQECFTPHYQSETALLFPRRKPVCNCFPQECFTPHYQSETALLVPRRNLFADVFRRNASHLTISQRAEHMCVNTLNNTDSFACPTAETCLQMFSAGMLHTSLSVRSLSTYVSTHWIIQTALLIPRRNMFADVFRRNTSHLIISQSSEHICLNTLDNLESVACPTPEHVCRCFPQECFTPPISQSSEHMCVNTLDNTDSVACPTAKHVCRCIPQECFTPHYQSEVCAHVCQHIA